MQLNESGDPKSSARDMTAQTDLPVRVEQNRARVERDFWPKARRFLARVPFMDQLLAAYYAAMDENTPLRARGILLAALAYFILPLDMLPDMMAGLGFTDDLSVLLIAINTAGNAIKPHHRLAARERLATLQKEDKAGT